MIVFDLKCSDGHVFEAWFRDSDAFEAQNARGEVTCPICGDAGVAKAPMAPAVTSQKGPPPEWIKAGKAMKALRQAHEFVEKHFDHVGPQFAAEARKIHEGEAEKRNIYGEATREEVTSLRQDGIEVGELPKLPRPDA